MPNPVIERLQEQRRTQIEFVDETLARVEAESRDLVEAESRNLDAARERITEIDAQLQPLEQFEELRGLHAQTRVTYAPAVHNGGEPVSLAARTESRGHEYDTRGQVVADIIRAAGYNGEGRRTAPDDQAADRLRDANVPWSESEARAVVNETTTEVPGLLPKAIVGAIDSDLDAARPFISSIGAKDLGSIPGKVFARPFVQQHTVVGEQTAEKTELPSQQFTVNSTDFTKRTFGGALDVSRQVIDWTSPAAWDALLTDLQDVYALETEEQAATAFATAVTQTYESEAAAGADLTLQQWATALYQAASLAYAGVKRLPTHIWVSLDMWATMGAVVDTARLSMRGAGGTETMGTSSPTSFAGNVFDLPRYVVPSFPAGTIIVGVGSKTEYYEQRIGLLQAVEPRLLGVEIAYGGYAAFGTLKPTAFAKIVNLTTPV